MAVAFEFCATSFEPPRRQWPVRRFSNQSANTRNGPKTGPHTAVHCPVASLPTRDTVTGRGSVIAVPQCWCKNTHANPSIAAPTSRNKHPIPILTPRGTFGTLYGRVAWVILHHASPACLGRMTKTSPTASARIPTPPNIQGKDAGLSGVSSTRIFSKYQSFVLKRVDCCPAIRVIVFIFV